MIFNSTDNKLSESFSWFNKENNAKFARKENNVISHYLGNADVFNRNIADFRNLHQCKQNRI